MDEGIFIEPGDVTFHSDDPPLRFFRLGFSAISEALIEPGVRKLGAVMGKLCRRAG